MQNHTLKVHFWKIMLALVVLLGNFTVALSTAQAQDSNSHIYLPMVTGGIGGIQAQDAEVQAAGSCYWGRGSGRIHFSDSRRDLLKIFQNMPNTSSCRDVNIHVEVSNPNAHGCNVSAEFSARDTPTYIYRSLPKNRWWVVIKGLSADTWFGWVNVTSDCGSGTIYWAS